MISFIKTVLLDLKEKKLNLENIHFVLPSKRAGVFLKHELSIVLENPIFSPQIISIEEFVEELSGLQSLPNIELLFKLYESYKKEVKDETLETFESFSTWAQILLQDFNEIDRYLIPQEHIFDYLKAIKTLNHWSLDTNNQTDLIKKHLKFWSRLKAYYSSFTESLLASKKGYQGLIYRAAAENLEAYIESNENRTHVFLGFNALNTAESQIIQGLLENDLALTYWDIDNVFINDAIHDAGLFTRQHRSDWKYYKKQPFNWVTSHYSKQKNINIIGVPKRVGQAKYIGQLLEELQGINKKLTKTAVVLGEEDLLIPVLNSLPTSIEKLNVTMGLPLHTIPLATLFEQLFLIHKNNQNKFYYKDVINLLSHPSLYPLFATHTENEARRIIDYIQNNNIVFLTVRDLKSLSNLHQHLIEFVFKSWENNPEVALKNCTNLIFKMKAFYDKNKLNNRLNLEYLYRFNSLFNQLVTLNSNYKYITSIAVLQSIYNELLSTETLDFKGEPLEGLQIMGMLESRVLDFETVIISSVNEGILPSGKTNNSFIPFDVKIENKLPTYKEKDAVYTYHFYRLLQRAKNIYILYNTEVDALKGGEKSRFISQLDIENIHQNITYSIAAPNVPVLEKKVQQITKTPLVIDKLKALAAKGFSPSSLSNYIRNPIDFYYDKILGITNFEDVEEHIAANTLGSVIHNTLEDFYKPLENKFLTIDSLNNFKTQIKETVTKHFKILYNEGDFTKGKNLIIFEIAQRYISNFIQLEIETLKAGNQIKIRAIEVGETIAITVEGLETPIKLTGKVDRIDELNGVTRVIDYKSGRVEQSKVEITNWEDLTTDYTKYSKSFQVLCYAYIMHKKKHIKLPVEAGIISFKNLNAGVLKFGKKTPASRAKNQSITEETLLNFEIELKNLILKIFDTSINFIEKELN